MANPTRLREPRILRALFPALLLASAGAAGAAPLAILDVPSLTDGTFSANVLHTIDDPTDPTKGAVLAYSGLDATQPSSYDPERGLLDVHLILYSDAARTNVIGTASVVNDGSTDPVLASEFGQFDDQVIGAMDHVITVSDSNSALAAHLAGLLDPSGSYAFTVLIHDTFRMTTPSGFVANSFGPAPAGSGFEGRLWINWDIEDSTAMGIDHLWVVPEPTAAPLLALGGMILALGRARAGGATR